MEYLTTAETAEKWGITSRRVLNLAKEGRIPGVVQIGTRWMIPAGCEKPADGRTKDGKIQKTDTFRYPCFEFKDPASFNPPLDREELILKSATEAFHGCRYRDCEKILGRLYDTANNRYHRITALYIRCMADIFLCSTGQFAVHYGRLAAELQGDFPHKKEMTEYIHMIDSTLGYNKYYADEFQIDEGYSFSEGFIPRLANLSSVSLAFAEKDISASELRAHELSCIFLEKTDSYSDLQSLHLNTGIACGLLGFREKSRMHLKKALDLADKYGLYYNLMGHYYFFRKFFKPVQNDFPEEFISKIIRLSNDTHRRFISFTDVFSASSIYKYISDNDYIFIYYAMQGLTNKEIADILNMSSGSVGKRFGDIYAGFGIKNKQELISLCRSYFTGSVQK